MRQTFLKSIFHFPSHFDGVVAYLKVKSISVQENHKNLPKTTFIQGNIKKRKLLTM